MGQRILMNAFSQCCPTPQSEGQWKNPRDRSVPGFNDVEFWIDLAKTADHGLFDSLFFADIHGVYDIYAGSSDAGIRHGVQVPGNEPTILFPLLARETRQSAFLPQKLDVCKRSPVPVRHFGLSGVAHLRRGKFSVQESSAAYGHFGLQSCAAVRA